MSKQELYLIEIVFICALKTKLTCFQRYSSGPIEVLVLAGDNAITKWRSLMGPTKVFKTIFSHPESIRGQFGLSDTRNACHGSDSTESAKREIEIFFPEFDANKWLNANVDKQISDMLCS